MTPYCRHNKYHCDICAAESRALDVNRPFEPWTPRPKFVTNLDPQATERIVNLLVTEICNVIEENVSKVKSAAPGKRHARLVGEGQALLAVVQRMQEHGLIATEIRPMAGAGAKR